MQEPAVAQCRKHIRSKLREAHDRVELRPISSGVKMSLTEESFKDATYTPKTRLHRQRDERYIMK